MSDTSPTSTTGALIINIATVIGAGLVLIVAVLLAWSQSDGSRDDNGAYVIDMDVEAAAFALPFGTNDNPLVPGDGGCRVIVVINDGSVDLTGTRLWLLSELRPGGYQSTTARQVPTATSTPLDTSFPDYLTVAVRASDGGTMDDGDRLAVPECGDPGFGPTDGGVESLPPTPVTRLTGRRQAVSLDLGEGEPGEFRAASNDPSQRSVKYLELRFQLSTNAPDDTQNVWGTLVWMFAGDPKV